VCSRHMVCCAEIWMCLERARPFGNFFCLNASFHPLKKMIEKNLRLELMEHDLQFLIEHAIAYEWQMKVELLKSLPASGRPKRVKLKFVLTFSDGTDVVLSATSKADCSSLSNDGECSVKYGLLKYEKVPIRSLAHFILNLCGESDKETTFAIESDGHVFTCAIDDDESGSNETNEDSIDASDDDDAKHVTTRNGTSIYTTSFSKCMDYLRQFPEISIADHLAELPQNDLLECILESHLDARQYQMFSII